MVKSLHRMLQLLRKTPEVLPNTPVISRSRMLRRATLVMLVAVSACGRSKPSVDTAASTSAPAQTASAQTAPAQTAPQSTPTPTVLGGNIRSLRWITGTWRGSGETQAPFYERYRLVDDSTLVVDGFSDSTLATVSESTRFRMRAGVLTSAPGLEGEPPAGTPQWYATALSADSVRFEPLVAVRNTFVWRFVSNNEWVAVLSWPASPTRPARQVTYTMRRISAPR
jgi:hypothetical protein